MEDFVDIEIRKPTHDNYVFIREKFLTQAMNEKKRLRITIPQGTSIMSPYEWMTGAKIIKKKFNYPTPMTLYGNYVRLDLTY